MKSNDIKVKGLTSKWLFNIFGLTIMIVAITQIVCSVLIYNYYYNSARHSIELSISKSTSFTTGLATATPLKFEQAAKDFIYNFQDKNKLELQVFDRNGNMIASSRGFLPEYTSFVDYEQAFDGDGDKAEWIGRVSSGETVMAVTTLMPVAKGVRVGALRYVVSLDSINRCIWYNVLTVFGVCLFIIIITVFSGMIFLSSIIKPIKAITAAAFRIANGNFEEHLPVDAADEIGKLCDTINYMASKLSDAETMKNDFISTVSHELRTPLTIIKGWGETTKNAISSDPKLVEKGIDVIISESERLSGLVEDLLDFSRMQSGRLQFNKQRIDILAELGEAVYLYQDTAKQQGVTIEYLEPEILPPVMADPNRLKQVFINILDNAVKYSEKGGQVLVEPSQHDIYVKVTIKDMGCGIPPEELNKVKEKFYKANSTVRGSGIGLAIADEIIKQHDGILMIDSKEGAGTTVSIILPYIIQ